MTVHGESGLEILVIAGHIANKLFAERIWGAKYTVWKQSSSDGTTKS